MERRPSAHLQATEQCAVVPTVVTYQLPLLPYEQDLIAALGISEQEYRFFVNEARRRSLTRPSGYEHIPDVQGGFIVPILINLAIGLVLTAVSALLAPKPVDNSIEQKKLADKRGRTRFNAAYGFDSAPQLATLGSRVPILFGRYVEQNESGEGVSRSGGLVVEPLTVWSRTYSNGSYQTARIGMVVGQAGIDPPSGDALMIGGQPLAYASNAHYSVWWANRNGENRLLASDLIHGEAADLPNGDVLNAPTMNGEYEHGFCMTHTPTNNAEFGVFQSIRNGGHIRAPWRVVSIPSLEDQEDDPKDRLKNERRKIAGKKGDGRWDGMPGIGRAYSVKMGVTKHNGNEYSQPTEVQVAIGDTITFKILGGELNNLDFDNSSDVTGDDLNSTIEQLRAEADDAMQLGELFLMNRSLFEVVERSDDVWTLKNIVTVRLRCVAITGANNWIGIIGTRNIEDDVIAEGGDLEPPPSHFKGANWFPLHRYSIGKFKNSRKTEVTEIGVKSQVWNQANNLCNFNSLPSPQKLIDSDKDRINIQSGTVNSYLPRTSTFVLAVRPANQAAAWDNIGEVTFAVQRRVPVDVYNYIRIFHPNLDEYMFRLLPKCSTNFRWAENGVVYCLNANSKQHMVQAPTNYGTFRLQFNADVKSLDNIFELKVYQNKGAPLSNTSPSGTVTAVSRVQSTGPAGYGGLYQGFLEQILGNLKNSGATFGTTRSANFTVVDANAGLTIVLNVKAHVEFMGEAWLAQWGTAKTWFNPTYTVVSVTKGTSKLNDIFYDTRPVTDSWYAQTAGWLGKSVTSEFRVDGINYLGEDYTYQEPPPNYTSPDGKYERWFETKGQIKEIAAYQEMSNSAERGPEHAISYVNESIQTITTPTYEDLTMLGVQIKSTRQIQQVQQIQVWLPNGIHVERLADGGTGPSNNFADFCYYLLTNERDGIGGAVSHRIIDKASFVTTAKFLRNNFWTFDAALSDTVNLRNYLTQIAPLQLCNFVVKNGKFSMSPAIPCDDSGAVNRGPIPFSAYFNDSNIIEGSYELSYLDEDARRNFKAAVKYQRRHRNAIPEERTIVVAWEEKGADSYTEEEIDLSGFCTKRGQAFAVARYMLSLRRRVDHVVKFRTIPAGLALAPGDYIRVDTVASPYASQRNGAIGPSGEVTAVQEVHDGTYHAYVFTPGSSAVVEQDITIANNTVTDPALFGSLFNVPEIQRRHNSYMVDELTLEEDGLVSITASHHPVDVLDRSKIVADVFHPEWFRVYE
jgi:hypothetical protein